MEEEHKKLKDMILEEVGYEPTNFGGKYKIPTLEIVDIAIKKTAEYYQKKNSDYE